MPRITANMPTASVGMAPINSGLTEHSSAAVVVNYRLACREKEKWMRGSTIVTPATCCAGVES
jgi:hypothetical protein